MYEDEEEQRLRSLEKRVAVIEASNKIQETILIEVRDTVNQLRDDWGRSKGMVTGIVLTISAIWGAGISIYAAIRDYMSGG